MNFNLKNQSLLSFLICLFVCFTASANFSEKELQTISEGFESRRDEAFEKLRDEELEIAEKREPLSPGRGRYVRHFSYSIVDFAFKSFWLNQDIKQANDALDINSQFYIDDRKTRNDRDSFY